MCNHNRLAAAHGNQMVPLWTLLHPQITYNTVWQGHAAYPDCLLCKNKEAFIEGLWSNSRCYLKHFPCLLPFQPRLHNFILLQFLEVLLGQVFQVSSCTSMSQYDPVTSLVHWFKCTIFDVRHCNMFLKFHIPDRDPNVGAITCQNLGLYSHHGSTSFQKSVLKAAIHEKNQEKNVFPDMKGPE